MSDVPSHNGARRIDTEAVPRNRALQSNEAPADHVRIRIFDRQGNVRASATLTPDAAWELSVYLQEQADAARRNSQGG